MRWQTCSPPVLPCLQAETIEYKGQTFQLPPAVDTVGKIEIRYHGCQGKDTWDDVAHLAGYGQVCVCVVFVCVL